MRNNLALIVLAAALTASGQPTTNAPTPRPLGGTAAARQGAILDWSNTTNNLDGATFHRLEITNTYQTAYTTNRTNITIAGAGTAGVNGTYVLKSTGVATIWTNSGAYSVVSNSGNIFSAVFDITNGAGADFYIVDAPDGVWTAVDGAEPVPTGTYQLTPYPTNGLTELQVRHMALHPTPTLDTVFIDEIGSDALGRRGYYPFRTIDGALTNAHVAAGDLVMIGIGDYTNGASTELPAGVALVGTGPRTRIFGALKVNSRCAVSSLTLSHGTINIVNSATNVFLYNLEACDDIDGLFLSSWGSFVAIDCYFHSAWDAVKSVSSTGVGWGDFYNCRLEAIYTNAAVPGGFNGTHGLSADAGKFRLFGGSVVSSNAPATNCVGIIVPGGGGRVEVNGTSFSVGTTNGSVYTVLNLGGTVTGNIGLGEVTLTSGSGVPSAAEANGSLYIRTDGAGGLYSRTNGGWTLIR